MCFVENVTTRSPCINMRQMKIAVAVGVLVLQQAIRRHQSQSLEQVRGLTSVRLEDSPPHPPPKRNKEPPDVSIELPRS